MEPIGFGRWRLLCDPQATRHAYAKILHRAAEACSCSHCQNYLAIADQIYPAEALDLLDRLGIKPIREAEVYHLARLDSGLHLYGGFLHFVGRIVRGGEAFTATGAADLERVGQHFSVGFTRQAALVPTCFDNLPVVQLEFLTEVPWVIVDPEPE